MREEVVKSPDWIQELYLKEMVYKSIKGEKTHGKYGPNAQEAEKNQRRNSEISEKLQTRTSTN